MKNNRVPSESFIRILKAIKNILFIAIIGLSLYVVQYEWKASLRAKNIHKLKKGDTASYVEKLLGKPRNIKFYKPNLYRYRYTLSVIPYGNAANIYFDENEMIDTIIISD